MRNYINILGIILIYYLLFSFSSYGQTYVSGGIYSSVIWSKANSPYIVTDTVVVFPGVVLSIEPGVVVKFDPGTILEIRQSYLVAAGSASDSITFTSNNAPSFYQGIILTSSISANFDYCNFFYAIYGINSDDCDNLSINHSTSSYNSYGFYCFWGNDISIKNSYVSNNTIGIITGATRNVIQYCSIIKNNTGITGGDFAVRNCVVDSNTVKGIILSSSTDSVYESEIKYNGIGISTGNLGNGRIFKNEIEFNDIGIELNDTSQIHCNKLCSNTTYNIKYYGNFNLNIDYNYWCTNDSLNIGSTIYDGYDNNVLGLLDFIPFDTNQCYLTGCNVHVSVQVTNATCDTCHNGHAIATVTNASQPIIYTWNTSPLQTNQTASGLASGNYTVCITDAHGCTACQNLFIDSTNCTGFMVNAHSNNATCSSCNDGSAWGTVLGGTSPYNYTWYTSPIQNTATASGLGQGNYSVCVTDLYGCNACDSTTVSIGNCSAHFNVFPDSIPHQYYAVNMASGIVPLSYSWSWGDGSPNDTTPFPDHLYASAGFYTICLSIIDSAGCTNTYCQSFYLMRSTNTMIYISVRPQVPTSISKNNQNIQLAIFPNPVNKELNLVWAKYISSAEIKIYNVTGELKIQKTIKDTTEKIDVAFLPVGVYFLELIEGSKIEIRKFVKIN